ncbi:hypothetical protein ONE63_007976 [Megalurothrips usitatus]|uniref:CCDC113/CCDC96 coiled-coil domain-containing protein n=1 Tax=Megalurothrips usitatus TaxID=439358 RepID=A0AAV7XRW2_9NEOP|nr:hypothetical protein ONE63_007976 [Megalurothrips usitatus]
MDAPQTEHNPDETERTPQEDLRGGRGDTHEKLDSLEEEHVKSQSTAHTEDGGTSLAEVSEDSKVDSMGRMDIRSRGGGEGSTSKESQQTFIQGESHRSSSESISSGIQIVTQLLEDLIDAAVTIQEKDKIEKDKEIGHDAEKSSILTIKSADEKGSVAIDAELQAQLALEQELAALQHQKEHQENIERYHSLIASRVNLKRKNAFLLRQMYENYKRKKIEHLFKEMPLTNVDMENKYFRALAAFEEVQNAAAEEEKKMRKHISTLQGKKQAIESEMEKEWNDLITREREVSRGLIIRQSTKHLSDKHVECLIQRQIAKSKEVTNERLIYFKLRDAAAADENHLKSLENLGDNFTLMEYEQLKMLSQSCVEKLEERDADLHRLRSKATSAIQVLAEIREKTRTLQEDMEASKVVLHEISQQLIQTRERVGCEKKRRDMSRNDTVRLRQEAGLLSEPKLLQDYKESLLERERLLKQLQDWKYKFESEKQNIMGLRRELAALQ